MRFPLRPDLRCLRSFAPPSPRPSSPSRPSRAALRTVAVAAGLIAAGALSPLGQAQGSPTSEVARMQGLPPAPPPSGIRPSRKRAPEVERGLARRATGTAFGVPLAIEVHGMPQAEADAALRSAVEAVREAERLLDPKGDPAAGGVATLNAAAGGRPVAVDPRMAAALEKTLSFCRWSDQAHGPLGGQLYRLWGLREPALGRPSGVQIDAAARSAACDHLATETTPGEGEAASARAQLAEGSRLDLWGFAHGLAVDHAVETLHGLGVEDAYVELGPVRRAFGPGVEGRGWPVTLPVFPGQGAPFDRVWLQDEAMAVASAVHRPLLVGGDRLAPWIDQRSGEPAEGTLGVVTVSELAVDAEALAAALFVLGNREGLLRLGNLRPTPHVLWLLGSGDGQPVLAQHNWTEISLR